MKLWIYKHYKWKNYEVVWLALNTETREKMVLYKCLYDTPELTFEYWKEPFFVRPYNNFNEIIIINNKKIKKFNYIWNKKYEDI
jgi:hypothetical protein